MANQQANLLIQIQQKGQNLLSDIQGQFTKLRTLIAGAFAFLTAGTAISAFKEHEEAVNRLTQAMIANGVYTSKLSKDYENIAKELQKLTGNSDEAIMSVQAQLQTFLGAEKVSKELTAAVLDLSAGMHIDLQTAAKMVGQSIASSKNSLKAFTDDIADGTPKAEKMRIVLEALEHHVGGQAAAQLKGIGIIKAMKESFGELMERIGEGMSPAVIVLTTRLKDMVEVLTASETAFKAAQALGSFMAMTFILVGGAAGIAWEAIKVVTTGFADVVATLMGHGAGAREVMNEQLSSSWDQIKKIWAEGGKALQDIDKAYDEQNKATRDQSLEKKREQLAKENAEEIAAAEAQKRLFEARTVEELSQIQARDILKNDAHLLALQTRIDNETDASEKTALELEKRRYLDEQYAEQKFQNENKAAILLKDIGIKYTKETETNLNNLATMQDSKIKGVAEIGKAAAIAQIAIDTATSATSALSWGTNIGGPFLGYPLAAAVIAYGAEKSARVAGIKFAEGGIVRATPGGVPAIIGEGGRDEAVIPLGDGAAGLGSTINITVQGGFLGNDRDLLEWAKKLDMGLFSLRKSNESLAFDRGLI